MSAHALSHQPQRLPQNSRLTRSAKSHRSANSSRSAHYSAHSKRLTRSSHSAHKKSRSVSTFIDDFLSGNSSPVTDPHKSLQSRRRRYVLRQIAVPLVGAALVFLSLVYFSSLQSTSTIFVSTHRIKIGQTLTSDDFHTQTIPRSALTSGTLTDSQEIVGKIAAVDIPSGATLQTSELHETVLIPQSYTTIEVSLASSLTMLHTGQRISLLTSEGCSDNQTSCILAAKAIVVQIPDAKKQSGVHSFLSSSADSATSQISLALPAKDALRVLQNSESAPIIAMSAD